MKRIIAVSLALLMLAALTGCGGNQSSASSSTGSSGSSSAPSDASGSAPQTPTSNTERTVTVWAWDPSFNIAALERARDLYEAEHTDVTIEIVEYAQDDIVQKLNTALSTGSTAGLPNIALIEDYRIQSFLSAYPGAFADLTDSIDISQFAEYKAAFTVNDGVTYGVPFDTGVTGLFYRSDLAEAAGYDHADLQNITWDQYIEFGKALQQVNHEQYLLTLDPDDLGLIRVVMQSCGTWYVREDGTTPYFVDNEPLREGILLFAELINSGLAKTTSDWAQYVGALNGGDAATTVSGCWILPSITAEQAHSGSWAVAPTPRLDGYEGAVNASNLGGSSFYVLEGVENSDLAIDFLAATFGGDSSLYDTLLSEIGAMGSHNALGD
ncbi:MAG: extracellular solute-binding protein, partial [Clostridia bacterium]|nr:extracellular solute-binding protein [Clostridia bacterium]